MGAAPARAVVRGDPPVDRSDGATRTRTTAVQQSRGRRPLGRGCLLDRLGGGGTGVRDLLALDHRREVAFVRVWRGRDHLGQRGRFDRPAGRARRGRTCVGAPVERQEARRPQALILDRSGSRVLGHDRERCRANAAFLRGTSDERPLHCGERSPSAAPMRVVSCSVACFCEGGVVRTVGSPYPRVVRGRWYARPGRVGSRRHGRGVGVC